MAKDMFVSALARQVFRWGSEAGRRAEATTQLFELCGDVNRGGVFEVRAEDLETDWKSAARQSHWCDGCRQSGMRRT